MLLGLRLVVLMFNSQRRPQTHIQVGVLTLTVFGSKIFLFYCPWPPWEPTESFLHGCWAQMALEKANFCPDGLVEFVWMTVVLGLPRLPQSKTQSCPHWRDIQVGLPESQATRNFLTNKIVLRYKFNGFFARIWRKGSCKCHLLFFSKSASELKFQL